MSGMMNGAPFWSPPSRHQKCYASMLGTPAQAANKPDLSEFPSLVEKAVRAGLIQRATAEAVSEQKARPPKSAWRVANCRTCGIRFERGKRILLDCDRCRIPLRNCGGCGKEFRPPDRKKFCCSKDCSRIMQVRNFKANYVFAAKTLVQCIVCRELKPARQAGSGVAKTCSPTCADSFRRNMNQLRTKTK